MNNIFICTLEEKDDWMIIRFSDDEKVQNRIK